MFLPSQPRWKPMWKVSRVSLTLAKVAVVAVYILLLSDRICVLGRSTWNVSVSLTEGDVCPDVALIVLKFDEEHKVPVPKCSTTKSTTRGGFQCKENQAVSPSIRLTARGKIVNITAHLVLENCVGRETLVPTWVAEGVRIDATVTSLWVNLPHVHPTASTRPCVGVSHTFQLKCLHPMNTTLAFISADYSNRQWNAIEENTTTLLQFRQMQQPRTLFPTCIATFLTVDVMCTGSYDSSNTCNLNTGLAVWHWIIVVASTAILVLSLSLTTCVLIRIERSGSCFKLRKVKISDGNSNESYEAIKAQWLGSNGSWLLDRKDLKRLHMVEKGYPGALYRSQITLRRQRVDVVVKTLLGRPSTCSAKKVRKFLADAWALHNLAHPHVLPATHVCFLDNGTPLVIYPDLGHSNFWRFLDKCRHKDYEPLAVGATFMDVVTTRQLTEFGRQVCQAVKYLLSCGIIHGDVAARNCVITGNMHIKLTDSSLAQGFFPEQYDIVEYGQTRELVSMRWRAYEVLFEKKHPSFLSEKWSFAVTLWEIYSKAMPPYSEERICVNDFKTFLNGGRRLSRPSLCSPAVYDCMVQCWSVDPYKRPSFEKIEELLSLALELLPSNELDSSSVTASVCARLGYNLRSPTRSFDFSTFSSGRVDYPGQLATPHRGNTYKLDNSSPLSLNNAATNMSGPPCCCDSGRCDCKAAKCGKSRCSKGRTLGNIPSTAKVVNVMQSSIEPANMQENDYVIMSSDVSYTTRSTCSSGQGSDESSQKSRAKDVVSIKLSFSPKGTKTVEDCERLGTCRRSSSLEGIKPLELAADHKWSSSNDAAHRHPPVLCSRLSPNRAAHTASLADLSSSSGNELPSSPPVSLCPANAPKQFKTSGNSDGIVHVFHV